MAQADVIVIGAGIAGASLAARLDPALEIVLIEAEDQPGYHSTGRSAALWHETLGGPQVRELSRASFAALNEGGYLTPRRSLEVAEASGLARLDALQTQFAGSAMKLERLDQQGIKRLVPRAEPVLLAGLLELDGADIDVGTLHGDLLAAARRNGVAVETRARIDAIACEAGQWTVRSGERNWSARVIVNAAGAWADEVARLAGVCTPGIEPRRRTMVQARLTTDDVPADLPLVMDVEGSYYFRPVDAQRMWLCPHDETPVEPHDVAPEDIDVAIAIHRLETVTSWRVAAVEKKWAGLRSFAPDRLPVVGFAPGVEGFYWLAGQGGVGIQTSPALSAIAAAHIEAREPDPFVAHIDAAAISPARFG